MHVWNNISEYILTELSWLTGPLRTKTSVCTYCQHLGHYPSHHREGPVDQPYTDDNSERYKQCSHKTANTKKLSKLEISY